MAVLQENVLSRRLSSTVHGHWVPGKSGYTRGADDTHLLLHKIGDIAQYQLRCIWEAMGDYRRAFPPTWRADILTILAEGPPIRGGANLLLHSIVLKDHVHVSLSGQGELVVNEGIPDGGTIGCLTYTTLPDSLVRELLTAGHGIGINVEIPAIWRIHVWKGEGSPTPV